LNLDNSHNKHTNTVYDCRFDINDRETKINTAITHYLGLMH